MRLAILCACTVFAATAQQTASPADPLSAFDFFAGTWHGSEQGQPGTGTADRQYRRTLNGHFVEIRNKAVFPRQEKNPKGETHEDWGMVSYDKLRKRFVLRQFHVEGFVNQYTSEAQPGAKEIVFTSEAIENIPAGWRARETWRIAGPGEFEEVFELAGPGKDFEVYSRARMKRVR